MPAIEAAGDVYLAIPTSALNVLLGSRHVGELGPGLRGRIPTPEVVVVTASVISATVDVNICPICTSTGAIAKRRTRRGRGPSTEDAAAAGRAGCCRGGCWCW